MYESIIPELVDLNTPVLVETSHAISPPHTLLKSFLPKLVQFEIACDVSTKTGLFKSTNSGIIDSYMN